MWKGVTFDTGRVYFMRLMVEWKSLSVEESTIHVQSMVLLLLWVVLHGIYLYNVCEGKDLLSGMNQRTSM